MIRWGTSDMSGAARAHLPEISWQASEAITSWCNVLNQTLLNQTNPRPILERAAVELLTLAKMEPGSKPVIVDALHDMAVIASIGDDEAQAIYARAERGEILSLLKSSKDFVAGFVPPDYLVDGLLQEAFLYSLTGATGAGKTAITLRLAASVANGRMFAGRETKQRRVLYLAAENPVDVRMRWIALAEQMDFAADSIEVYFVEGAFKISEMADTLKNEAERAGGEFGLVIIDTGPVFYEGDDENNRKQKVSDEDQVLAIINADPAASLATIATKMEWKLFSGEPYKMKAKRTTDALKAAKLIKETRAGNHMLTDEGKKTLKGEEK
jgi:hypothetical protein